MPVSRSGRRRVKTRVGLDLSLGLDERGGSEVVTCPRPRERGVRIWKGNDAHRPRRGPGGARTDLCCSSHSSSGARWRAGATARAQPRPAVRVGPRRGPVAWRNLRWARCRRPARRDGSQAGHIPVLLADEQLERPPALSAAAGGHGDAVDRHGAAEADLDQVPSASSCSTTVLPFTRGGWCSQVADGSAADDPEVTRWRGLGRRYRIAASLPLDDHATARSPTTGRAPGLASRSTPASRPGPAARFDAACRRSGNALPSFAVMHHSPGRPHWPHTPICPSPRDQALFLLVGALVS
jgi:hypothetical protein